MLVDMVEKDKFGSNKRKNMKKNKNKIIKVLAKSRNLLKFRSKNLFKFKNPINVQNDGIIKELNFLTFNTKGSFYHIKVSIYQMLIFQYFDLEYYP